MGDKEARRDFPDQAQRAAFCHSVFKKKRASQVNQQHFTLAIASFHGIPRTEQLMGREYLVVSAVLVQGQVLNNNLGASFLPPDEITDEWAQEWDHAPVIVDHPTNRGVPVSARSPEVLDARGIGFVFRAHAVRNGTAQLKAEVWLDVAREEEVPELHVIIQKLNAREKVELSTGFAAALDKEPGVFNGERYDVVMHPQGADHLAIFVDQVGACAVDDGCGLGANKKEVGDVDQDKQGADESTRHIALRAIDSLAALIKPAEATTTDGDDPLAESRVLLSHLKCAGLTNGEISVEVKSFSADLLEQIQRHRDVTVDAVALVEQLRAVHKKHKLSDDDRRSMLSDGLNAEFGGTNRHVWVDAVFSEKDLVIFGVMLEQATGVTEELFSADFTIDEDANEVTFSDPTAVARRVVYEPVGNISTEEDKQMKTEAEQAAEKAEADKVEAANKKVEADKVEAENKAEADKAEADKVEAANKKAEADKAEADAANAEAASIATVMEAITKLTDVVAAQNVVITELKTVTAPAVAENERERKEMVEQLAANEAVPFDQAELEAKSADELRKLMAMSRGENYAARGGPQIATHVASGGHFAEPVAYYEQKEGAE